MRQICSHRQTLAQLLNLTDVVIVLLWEPVLFQMTGRQALV